MEYLQSRNDQGITTVTLSRGKVNAINEAVIDEMTAHFRTLAADAATRAVILSGQGKFFTYGFDIPEFLGYPEKISCAISQNSRTSTESCSCSQAGDRGPQRPYHGRRLHDRHCL